MVVLVTNFFNFHTHESPMEEIPAGRKYELGCKLIIEVP
jgi:hypothetical protein